MIGVLIVAGIIGYGVMYTGLSHLPGNSIPPTSILTALWPKAQIPTGFGKSKHNVGVSIGTPRGGRT